MTYEEPLLTVAVLDYTKPVESRLCLESIKKHIRFKHRVVFCDNGSGEDYPVKFVREGLVDQLIINRESTGLGLGTRDIMNASFSSITMMMQNDQLFIRDFTEAEFYMLAATLGKQTPEGRVASITLAGRATPINVYGERAHIISTTFYKDMERRGALGYHGAGKYHSGGPWREAQVQEIYRSENLIHWMPPVAPWVRDNGVWGVRDMGDSGVYAHRTDSKALYVIVPPKVDTAKNPVYPKVSDEEFETIRKGEWQDGRIPEAEVKDSFDCWSGNELASRADEYIADLRRRFKEKRR